MCIPVHSSWLPDYTDVLKTILVIFTVIGLFPDRPRMLSEGVTSATMSSPLISILLPQISGHIEIIFGLQIFTFSVILLLLFPLAFIFHIFTTIICLLPVSNQILYPLWNLESNIIPSMKLSLNLPDENPISLRNQFTFYLYLQHDIFYNVVI